MKPVQIPQNCERSIFFDNEINNKPDAHESTFFNRDYIHLCRNYPTARECIMTMLCAPLKLPKVLWKLIFPLISQYGRYQFTLPAIYELHKLYEINGSFIYAIDSERKGNNNKCKISAYRFSVYYETAYHGVGGCDVEAYSMMYVLHAADTNPDKHIREKFIPRNIDDDNPWAITKV